MSLSPRDTNYRALRVISENIDAEIVAAGWQNETLGQSEDVRTWIENPDKLDRRIVKNLKRFVGLLKNGDRVLDVGCYGGYAYDWLAKRLRLQYLGLDIEPGVIRTAAQMHRGAEARFAVGDAFKLGGYRDAFDAVLCLRLVIHAPYLDRVLANLLNAAPVALVGLRVDSEDRAVERLDEVSGQRHFYRWFSLASVEKAVPLGCEWKIYRDGSYDSLVIRRGK